MPIGLAFLPLKIAGFGIGLINDITTWVASLKGSTLWVPSFPVWGLSIIIFGGLFLFLQKNKLRHIGWLFIFVGALSLYFVKMPDLIIADNGNTIAAKNDKGKLELLAGGNKWMKQNWADKYGATFSDKESFDKNFNLSSIDFSKAIGISVYGDKILTIRDYIGARPWNK